MMTRKYMKPVLAAIALTLVAGITPAAFSEEPIPTELNFSEAERYEGSWLVTLDFNGNEMSFNLDVVDIKGKVGATLDSKMMSEPQAVETITQGPDGLDFKFTLNLGGNEMTMHLVTKESAGGLKGTLSEQSGLFSGEITGRKATKEDFVQGRRGAPTEARLRLPDNKKVRVTFGNLNQASADFKALQDVEVGTVFKFTGSRATKLITETSLNFDGSIIKTNNVADNYPGVYSLWLKKTDAGWSLVFNEQPDIWGTQHKAEFDVAEVALTTKTTNETAKRFVIKLEETTDGGQLKMAWGNTQWSTPFSLSQ